MDYREASLEKTPFNTIHRCFTRSFADYAVKAAVMDEAALARRARKNNWVPELSSGIWRNEELVALSLTGLDRLDGELRGYDICTGVRPGHRGQGLAGRMVKQMLPALRRAGAQAFQLEVLQDNMAAIRAYRKAGFSIVRGLVSFAANASDLYVPGPRLPAGRVALTDLMALVPEQDFEPSFEQRDGALQHLSRDLLVVGVRLEGQCIAALAFDPATGWIMRWVTHEDYRRRGAAASLLGELARRLDGGAVVKAVNIDEADTASQALAKSCGLKRSLSQWEMRLAL